MDGKESVPQPQEGPPRPALITPSASPPTLRSLALLTSRISLDRSPPPKRRRLASTPSSPFSLSTPTASSADPFDIHEIRQASFQRLINTWSSLAERYNRPLDQDDIIDLRDGSIIKDRGVLRNAGKKFDFASDDVPSDVNDASSDYGGVQTDDDELDAFAPGADISGGLELEREKLAFPPMQERDPADAKDLRDFLEEERLRKEQYGDDEDEEEVVNLMTIASSRSSTSSSLRRPSSETSMRGRDNRMDEVPVDEDDMDEKDDILHYSTSASSTKPLPGDDSSDDEFATWDFDTTTPVKPTKPQRPATPDDVIDLTESPLSSPSRAPSPCGNSQNPSCETSGGTQPQSLPRGRSKTPAKLVSVTKGPPQPKMLAGGKTPPRPKTPNRPKTPSRQKNSMPPPPVPSASASQLATPPPSSSSLIGSIVESATNLITRSPSPSPPPLPRPKPRPRFKAALQAPGSSSAENLRPAPGPQSTAPEANAKTPKSSCFRLVPEVVITTRARMPAVPSRALSSRSNADKPILEQTNAGQPPNHDDKSKKDNAKATKGSDDRRHPKPDEGAHKGVRVAPKQASSTQRAAAKDTAPVVDQEESEDDTPLRAKSRKRKRVLSSSPPEMSDKDEVFPTITPIVPSRAHSKAPPKDAPGPSSSSRTPKPTRRTAVYDDDSDDARPEPPPPLPPPRNRTPYKPIPPKPKEYHHATPPPAPHTPQHHNAYIPYPPGGGGDPHAQIRFAQAAHYLSYIMNAAASLPHPPGYPPGYSPLPFPVQTPQWPPWTPEHRSQQDRPSGLSSPYVGPSGSSSYNTPSHSHPYPFTFDPAYSSASLPPSSPPASSEPSSPLVRSSSLARGRSKSRGRRVSFKLDSSDRPILQSPPRFDHDAVSDDAAADGYRRGQARGSDTSGQSATRPKAQGRVARAGTPAVKPDKGKARAEYAEDSDGSDRGRGRRGRTPGPAHSERSASARAAGRKT